jgi:lipopolysaccharide biosynthesis glycosyltransferase
MQCPIVLACDGRYAMPLATTLRSAVEANDGITPFDFHILVDGMPQELRQKVCDSLPKGSASIQWIEVNLEKFRDYSTLGYISKLTYARFLIPQIFPAAVSRVLYLDCDILVLDDLRKLCATDLDGHVLGAVHDGLDVQIKRNAVQLDVPHVQDYFNAGVLLIDLDLWREKQIVEAALDYLKRHPNTHFADQDALNYACDGLWKQVDPRWNYQAHSAKLNVSELPADRRPGVVHFTTWKKPWLYSAPNANAALFDSFRSRTRFGRTGMKKMEDTLRAGWSRIRTYQEAAKRR